MATPPSAALAGQEMDQHIVNSQRSQTRGVEIAERIGKERDYLVGGTQLWRVISMGVGGDVIGTRGLGGSVEVAVGIDND